MPQTSTPIIQIREILKSRIMFSLHWQKMFEQLIRCLEGSLPTISSLMAKICQGYFQGRDTSPSDQVKFIDRRRIMQHLRLLWSRLLHMFAGGPQGNFFFWNNSLFLPWIFASAHFLGHRLQICHHMNSVVKKQQIQRSRPLDFQFSASSSE